MVSLSTDPPFCDLEAKSGPNNLVNSALKDLAAAQHFSYAQILSNQHCCNRLQLATGHSLSMKQMTKGRESVLTARWN